MKRIILLFFTVAVFPISNIMGKQYDGTPQTITITGQIDNYDPNQQLTLSVNRLGFDSEQLLVKPDSVGNFMAFFESYIPVDVGVSYKNSF